MDSATPGSGQSKRPPLNRLDSDSQSDHQRAKQKHHHVGRLGHGARVNSSKALHKYQHQHPAPSVAKPHRRPTSRPASPTDATTPRPGGANHRRAVSDFKIPRHSSATNLPKSASHSSLKRNRSHVDVTKRTRSTDKLKRTSSGTGIHRHQAKSSKAQVQFDLGDEEEEDEWVDASESNSPFLSRKGSIVDSGQSSLRNRESANNSRPETPDEPPQPAVPSPDRERAKHKEYLTTRLLQRTPSHGAPPQMTPDLVEAAPPHLSPTSTDQDASTLPGSMKGDVLTSRFVDAPGSGLTSQGSFYHPVNGSRRSEDSVRRPRSLANFARSQEEPEAPQISVDDSALVPRPARRTAAPAAETSRIQQKLNLQRASSVIEPGQTVAAVSGVVGASPLIGVGGPGYDGGNSRDPRVSKLLERTGMEYLVVRRYQNSVARSLNRLNHLPGAHKKQRIPRNAGIANGKRSLELPLRHARNVSMPDQRRPVTPKRVISMRTNGDGASIDGDDESRINERLSGSSLVGGDEEDGTAALLRNLWEKSMDLSASTD